MEGNTKKKLSATGMLGVYDINYDIYIIIFFVALINSFFGFCTPEVKNKFEYGSR